MVQYVLPYFGGHRLAEYFNRKVNFFIDYIHGQISKADIFFDLITIAGTAQARNNAAF